MTNAELHLNVIGKIGTTLLKASFDWQRAHPALVTMTAAGKPWELSRTVLWAATREPCLGAWVGGGDVSVCDAGGVLRLMLYPSRNRPTVVLRFPDTPIVDFLDHAERLCPSHGIEEEVLIGAEIDRAIEKILG